MTQSAGIQLQVGLDLAFFRQQLTTLGAAAAGYPLKFKVEFDRRSVQNELNALGRNISQRTYRLEVKTNLETEIRNAKKLADALVRLQQVAQGTKGSLPVGTDALGLKKGAGQPSANDIKALYEALAMAGAEGFETGLKKTRAQMVTQIGAVAKDTVAGLLNGINSQDARVQAAARSLGESLITSIKATLGIASPSKKFEKIGKNVGEGFEKGALSSMDSAFDALEGKMRQRGKILDTVARGIFRMLGMDPAAMLQQARQQRLPAAINWQATTPPRQAFTGPSSSGRALPPGPTQTMLPGTSFGRQKYLPTALSEELKKVLRDAANAFVDTLKTQVRTAKILDLGRTMQPSLAGSRIAGLLPAAAGRTPSPYSTGRIGGETQSELFARREREARMRSAQREMEVLGGGTGRPASPYSYVNRAARPTSAIVPYSTGGALVPAGGGTGSATPPRPPSGGGGGGMGGAGGFGRALGSVNLPGAGVVREIGEEFGMATKQVLLFGTAYKALAFITSFPAQVGESVGALQSFRNTLSAISPTAQEAAASSEFILNIVDKYNVPLQSARDGFTKLYASMAPTGFSGNEIRDLFTGISQAAATFGMSSDKVDRVTYAFAQMASKGQVMSEELKGQLGDVLPGAMGIFAKAAGFEGADAIQKFGKALEDGAYKGKPMRDLLKNVTIELKKEFGPGAEGAARTYQGVMTRMANSTKLLYESFEPVAINFLNSVVVPLTSGIKTVADGFNAFFTGTLAKTAGGAAFAQQLSNLKPAFEGIRENIGALIPSFQTFGKLLLSVAQFLVQLAGNPITGFLLKVYANVLLVNTAFTLLGGRIILGLIASVNAAIIRFVAFGYAINAVGIQTTGANTALAGTQLQMLLLQRSTGAALAPVNALLGSLARIAAIGTIAVVLTVAISNYNQLVDAEARLNRLRGAKAESVVGPQGPRPVQTAQERFRGASRETIEDVRGKQTTYLNTLALKRQKAERELQSAQGLALSADADASSIIEAQRPVEIARKKLESIDIDIKNASEVLRLDPRNYPRAAEIATASVPMSPGSGTGTAAADKAAQDAARLASQQQQNAIDAANLQNALDKARYDGLTTLGDQAFQHATSLIDARNNYELAGLDSIASRQEKFQQDLQKIELDRIDTVRQATQKAVEASLKFAAAQNTAVAASAGRTQGGGTGLFQGSTGISSGPHFDVRRADGGIISEAEARALFSEDVRRQLTMTSGYGPRRAPAPGASTFHRGIDLAGPANTPLSLASGYSLMGVGQEGGLGYAASVQGPQGQSYKVGHLQKPGAGHTMQRREAKAGGNLQVEQLERSNALEEASLIAINATTEALAKREALIASNINTIFPVAEQRLQNDLTKIRNDLQLKGMPQEYIDYQEESYKASYEMSEAIKKNKEDTDKYQQTVDALQGKKAKGIALTTDEANALTFYTGAIVQNKASLETLTKQQAEYNIAALEGAIAAMKNADALKAQQEAMALIKGSVESASSSYKGFMKEVAMGGDPSEALKKFQEAITDQVLTVFFDFAMKPVEDFFKNQLSAMFGIETEESARKKAIATAEEQLSVARGIAADVKTIATAPAQGQAVTDAGGFPIAAPGGIVASMTEAAMNGAALPFEAGTPDATSVVGAWGDSLNTQLSESLTKATKTTDTEGNKLGESLGKATQGIGIAAGAIMGIAAGIGQIKEGGTSNVLGGIGSVLMSLGGAVGGFANFFKGANGGVAGGGWKPFPVTAFANGGMVKGPTLGLVGEGKYNEAIVPLPDGKSIPVQMKGGGGLREAMGQSPGSVGSPILNMSFQSTNINGVEYVSRDQLEAAMAATRKQAANDGANRGMNMTLDKIRNSPSTRSRVGIR